MSENDLIFSDEDWNQLYAILQTLAPAVLRSFRFPLDRDDIVQDVALKLLTMKSQGKLPPTFHRGLLAIMLKRRAIDVLKSSHQRNSSSLGGHDIGLLAAYSHSRSPILDDLAIVLEKLPKEERLLFESYVDGVSINALAKSSQMSYSAMAQRLHRLKDKLRNWLLEIKE